MVSHFVFDVFSDDDFEVGDELLGKRLHSGRPKGSRSSARVVQPRMYDNPSMIKKTTANKKRPTKPDDPEQIPEGNLGDIHAEQWREFRLRDPYCFKKRTYSGGDKMFWTEGQKQMWDDHYNEKSHFKRGWVMHQHALHMRHYNNHIQDNFHFIDECLRKLGVLEIAALKHDYYPDVFDDERNMTWMYGSEQCYATYDEFCEALGFVNGLASGYKIHSETAKGVSDISFYYPTLDRLAEPAAFSGMYYTFNALAKFFRENLVCKKGDAFDIRGNHINLLYWCKPGCQRKIDVCDFIFCELKRSVLTRMTPGYCAFVQKFIDSKVEPKFAHTGERHNHASFSIGLSAGWLEHPSIRHPTASTLGGSPMASSSRHRVHAAPRKKSGAAKFFKNLWDMCKSTNDVAHQALVMSQETRTRQNEFFASKNYAYPPPSAELNPPPYVNYVMPPIDDEMFFGYSVPSSQGCPRASRSWNLDDEEILEDEDGDEDEGEAEGKDEDDADAESLPHPFA
jgi:hypothetical protein